MFYWIYDIPTSTLAGLFAAAFVGFSWFGAIFIRPLLRLFIGTQPGRNDLVGYILSCFCVFYGLLLGLVAVAAYQSYAEVEATVGREAASLGALYRDLAAYPEPTRTALEYSLRDYCQYVIKEAWPQQRRGIIPRGGTTRMNVFQAELMGFQPTTRAQEIWYGETIRQFNHYIELRRERLRSVETGLPAILWYVVIIGGLLTIVIVWLFDMRLLTHLVLGGLLAFFLGTMICLIAALDNPYRGEFSVSPHAFEIIYDSLMQPGNRSEHSDSAPANH